MIDKKKQIEEMAKDCYYVAHLLRFNDPYMLSLKGWSELTKEMIKLGWIKPAEDSVVLSGLELLDYKHYKEYTKSLAMVEKETAEKDFNTVIKALEERKERVKAFYGVAESVGVDIAIRTVEELARQLGVEIKE